MAPYEPMNAAKREELMQELKKVHDQLQNREALSDRRAELIEQLYTPRSDRAGGRLPYESLAEIGRELGYESNPSDRAKALMERRWRYRE